MNPLQDVFISYGRADSLAFATRLNKRLMAAGLTVWFDYDDIPEAVPYQKQIDDGIEKADNFIFLISPHSINSPYCGLEVELAINCGKRIIPLLHVEKTSYETWRSRNPQGTEEDWADFQAAGKDDYFANMPPILRELNWIYCREGQDDIDLAVQKVLKVIGEHREHVRRHTELLIQALAWERDHKQTDGLLTGDRCEQGLAWLQKTFTESQPPCEPTDLQCEFITESLKNANNLMTQVFLAYADADKAIMEQVRRSLWREGIVVWVNTNLSDIQTGEAFQQAINQGIEQADNLVYLLSPQALASPHCHRELSYAHTLHKRIIPILVSPIDPAADPDGWLERQYIDLTEVPKAADHRLDIGPLLRTLNTDADYYRTHKVLLVQALKWQQQHQNPSILLRGYNLRQAETWLKTAQMRDCHLPTTLQVDLIEASLRQPPVSSLDVFISYSRTDSDFARRLNDTLQIYGKTTWFDQESIAKGSGDFSQEIPRGIEVSNNILFILSPRSLQSGYCQGEVEYAASLNKRFVTVLYRDIDTDQLPTALKHVQWLDFTQSGPQHFWEDFNQLVRVLETDREYLQSHTKWSQQAIEWEQHHRSQDLLLRGSEFAIADQWLQTAETEHKQPVPTALQKDFIRTSQQAIAAEIRQEKRQKTLLRSLVGVMTAVACVAVGTGIWASTSRRQAIKSEIKALTSTSEAEFTTGQSFDAVVTALKAEDRLRTAHWLSNDQALLDRVTTALQQAVYLGRETHRIEGFNRIVWDVKFSPGGETLLTLDNQQIQLWQADGSPVMAADGVTPKTLEIVGNVPEYGAQMFIHTDMGDIMAISYDYVPKREIFIQRWNSAGEPLPTLTPDAPNWEEVYVSPDGSWVITSDGDRLQLWRPDGTPIAYLPNSADVSWLRFSADGQTLASLDTNPQQARIWHLTDHTHQVFSVPANYTLQALSPDGTQLIFSDEEVLRVYQADGTPQLTLGQSQIPANADLGSVVFSEDGQHIAAAYNFNQVNRGPFVRLWNAQGELMASLDGHNAGIQLLKFSPNGQHLVTASQENIAKLWQLDGTLVDTFVGHADQLTALDFHPDSSVLASRSWDATLRLWSLDTALAKRAGVDSYAFNPEKTHLVTGLTDGPMSLWNADGQLVKVLVEQNAGAFSGYWNEAGDTFVSVAYKHGQSYGPVQVWNTQGELQATLLEQQETDESDAAGLLRIKMNDAGDRILTIEQTPEVYGPVKLWNREGQLLDTLIAPYDRHPTDSGYYNDYATFTQNGQAIITQPKSAQALGPAELWDVDGRPLATLVPAIDLPEDISDEDYRRYSLHVRSSTEGDALVSWSVTPDKTNPVRLWNHQGQLLTTLFDAIADENAEMRTYTEVYVSPNGETVIGYQRNRETFGPMKLWNAQGQLLTDIMATIEVAEEDYLGIEVTYSPDGKTWVLEQLNADSYGPMELWSQEGTMIETLLERSPRPPTVESFYLHALFSEDSQTLITHATDGNIQRWRTTDGQLLNIIKPPFETHSMWMPFSPDAELLAVPTDAKTFEIWDVEGRLLKTIRGEGDVYGAQFSKNSQHFAVGNYDNQVRLWRRDRNSLVTLGGHDATVGPEFLHESGNLLVTIDSNQMIFHQLEGLTDLARLVEMGCDRVALHLEHGASVEERDRALCEAKTTDRTDRKAQMTRR